ncbi:MAG TPA: GrpB family protein [Candidatus Dormibacteraeota bacterium]
MVSPAPQADDRQTFVDYDTDWPVRFVTIAAPLRAALPEAAVEHYGSTSVPGLGGRPIVDLQVALPPGTERESFEPILATLGYVPFIPPDMASLADDGMIVYVPADGGNAVHIAVVSAGGFHHRRQLAVRDYLRAHPQEAAAYAEVKRQAAASAGGVRERYAAAKGDFVAGLQERALRWAEQKATTEL